MHVLQLGPYPPPEGGINRNMLAIRDELEKNGHQCSIIATAKSSKITPKAGVYHPRTPLDLIKLLSKLNYDVLHLHIGGDVSARILGLMATCAFFGRGKSVLTFHSGGYALANVKTAKPSSAAGIIFRRFEKIIGVNSLMIQMFERFGIETNKLHLIYPFVLKSPDETVEISAPLRTFAEKHKPFLLAVCLLEETYDLFVQIDALEKVLDKFPDAGLMIVGSGSLEAELKKAIAAKPYARNVFLTGDVEHKITLHLINKADILLRTTLYDGDAIAVREALHLETPVIATDNKMRPEGVHLIPIHDEESLVEAIGNLATHDKKIKTEKSDDRSNIDAVLKVYEEVLSKR
ncbi:MAG TPA: glycosyltransferase family 4 protein [Pyrinomonadaceae bacterium]|nr:glycosyltransferase family 4 protein [Pyrinomonadaceae bacterium]